MKKKSIIYILFFLVFFVGCRDNEKIFVKVLKKFDHFMSDYILFKNRSRSENIKNQLYRFVNNNKTLIVKYLDRVYHFRYKNERKFRLYYKKYKSNIISIFKKLESIDKKEKLLFIYFSYVFSPDKIGYNNEKLTLYKKIFVKYCALLVKMLNVKH